MSLARFLTLVNMFWNIGKRSLYYRIWRHIWNFVFNVLAFLFVAVILVVLCILKEKGLFD